MKKNRSLYFYIYGFLGLLGLIAFIDHICAFKFPDYFYNANPGIKSYSGINVVSRWADFSFFTYHTLIFFSIFCIGLFISHSFKLQRLESLLLKKSVISFVVVNYIITTVVYTIFELTSGNITFGLYANTPGAYYNFGVNIFVHYFLFIFAILLLKFFKAEDDKDGKKFLPYILISIYLLIYFLVVKITGMHCYVIEWYPYFVFSWEWHILILCYIIFTLIYSYLYYLIGQLTIKVSNKN